MVGFPPNSSGGWRFKKNMGVINLKLGERSFLGNLTEVFLGFLWLLTSKILPADPLLNTFLHVLIYEISIIQ